MELVIYNYKEFMQQLETLSSAILRDKSAEDSIKVLNFILDDYEVNLMTTNRQMFLVTKLEEITIVDMENWEDFCMSYLEIKKELSKYLSLSTTEVEKVTFKLEKGVLKLYVQEVSKTGEDRIYHPSETTMRCKQVIGSTKELYKKIKQDKGTEYPLEDFKTILRYFIPWGKVQSLKREKVYYYDDYAYSMIMKVFAFVYRQEIPEYFKGVNITFEELELLTKVIKQGGETFTIRREESSFNRQNQPSAWVYVMTIGNYTVYFEATNVENSVNLDMQTYFIRDEIQGFKLDKMYFIDVLKRFDLKEELDITLKGNTMILTSGINRQTVEITRIGDYTENINFRIVGGVITNFITPYIKAKEIKFDVLPLDDTRIRLSAYVDEAEEYSVIISRLNYKKVQ